MHSNRSTMYLRRIAALALGAVIVLPALARSTAPSATTTVSAEGVEVLPGSRLWIEGTSTMHGWASTATRMAVTFSPAAAAGLESLVRDGKVQKFEVSIPVADMKSEKAALDKNMRTALKADKHPAITYKLASYQIAGAATDTFTVKATGTLSIAGVEKSVDIDARGRRDANGIRLTGSKELLMTDYGIKPPTMMMGTLRTGNKVQVRFELLLSEQPAAVGVAGEGSK